jgi:hypothetical protein
MEALRGLRLCTLRRRKGEVLGLKIFQSKANTRATRGVSVIEVTGSGVAEKSGLKVDDVLVMVQDWVCIDSSRKMIADAFEVCALCLVLF